MKKILFVCNTYMQLIIAIHMKYTIMKNDFVTVLISDHSRNASAIAENLKAEKFFERVEYIKTNNIDNGKHGMISAMTCIVYAVRGKLCQVEDFLGDIVYDQLFYYNLNISTVAIFSYLYKKNHYIMSSRYEEGINSYNNTIHDGFSHALPVRLKYISLLRKIFGLKNVWESVESFYCFHPEYYMGGHNVKKISLIDNQDKKFKDMLNRVFQVDAKKLDYKQKYIYFAGIGDFTEETAIGEVKLAKIIADFVGRENLLVKTHPRDRTDAFKYAGLNVDERSAVPWEIIQLNYNFKNHVFLTACSGSVLTMSTILEERPQIYFLYPMCDISKNKEVQKVIRGLENIINMLKVDTIKEIHVINNLNKLV